MAELTISFTGMVLVGHGGGGEAWLVDTNRVQVGHRHRHTMSIGSDAVVNLDGGKLVTFLDGERPLIGRIDLGGEADEMVDLDNVLSSAPRLKAPLLTANPKAGDPWTNLLAAWIRLPPGTVDAKAEEFETWTFPTGTRKLSEFFRIKVPDVAAPSVVIESGRRSPQRIEIPEEQGAFHVQVKTVFAGERSQLPAAGDEVKLDEVLLLYGCVTEDGAVDGRETARAAISFSDEIPVKTFTEADVRRMQRRAAGLTDDLTVCPCGCARLPARRS